MCPLCDLPEMQGAWAALQALLAGPPGHPLSGSTVLLRWPRLPASMAALLMLACGKGAVKRCCTRTLLSHLPPKAAKKLVKAAVPAAHLAEAAAVMAAAGAGGSAQAALVQLLRLVLEPQQ